jgi:hypothetical protein
MADAASVARAEMHGAAEPGDRERHPNIADAAIRNLR